MSTCGSCAAEVQEGDRFCGVCGEALASPSAADDGAHGPAAVVVTNRSSYERSAEHLDPLGARYTAAASRQAAVFAFIAAIATLLVQVGPVSAADRSTVITLVWAAAFITYLLKRIPVSLSEWKTLIEGKGPQAEEIFGHVAHTLRRRQVPVDSIRVRQLSQPGHPRHDYLEVRHGILTGYVTCFPYGTDLYIGWTLWWRFTPLHYAAMATGRRWQIFTVRGSELHLLYRYDIAKAMREAMHAATGEAVDAARGLRRLEPLPADVPIDTVVAPPQRWDPALAPRAGA